MAEVSKKIIVPTHKLFTVGELLISHHGPAGFTKEKGQKWFNCLSVADCEQLVYGNEVWICFDVSGGNVYGRELIKINSVINNNFGLLIYLDSGCCIVKDCDLATLTDEQQVYDWTKDEYFSRHVRVDL